MIVQVFFDLRDISSWNKGFIRENNPICSSFAIRGLRIPELGGTAKAKGFLTDTNLDPGAIWIFLGLGYGLLTLDGSTLKTLTQN